MKHLICNQHWKILIGFSHTFQPAHLGHFETLKYLFWVFEGAWIIVSFLNLDAWKQNICPQTFSFWVLCVPCTLFPPLLLFLVQNWRSNYDLYKWFKDWCRIYSNACFLKTIKPSFLKWKRVWEGRLEWGIWMKNGQRKEERERVEAGREKGRESNYLLEEMVIKINLYMCIFQEMWNKYRKDK